MSSRRSLAVVTTFCTTLGFGAGTGWAVGQALLANDAPALDHVTARPRPEVSPATQALLRNLTSPDGATWREAAVRLALLRPFPDAPLGALVATHPERVRETALRAMRQCLPLRDVEDPALLALLAPRLAEARAWLKGEATDASLRASVTAGPLRGAEVAVAAEALRSTDGREVVLGLRLLADTGASCARPLVVPLLKTGTPVFEGAHDLGRVGDEAAVTLDALPERWSPLADLEEQLADLPVFATVREVEPAAAAAATVDAWFELARPVWRAYWSLRGAGGPPAPEAWDAKTNELLHFVATRRVHPRGRTLLHVRGPESVRCGLTTTGSAEGADRRSLPFDFEGDELDELLHLECVASDRVLLARTFEVEPGDELTVEVSPP
ncbi:MAG: hypothetical protein INH41_30755 [Myxococcaceae bacterium]|nr:hypothetical protein [Myxococcaceae bacterium]MCA3016787.1 hypothetical protein [Myxococcaceae bacterium]